MATSGTQARKTLQDAATTAALGAATKVIKDALSDERVQQGVATAAEKGRSAVSTVRENRDPLVRLERKLDAVDAQLDLLATGDLPEAATQAAVWRQQAALLRQKLPLVQVQTGRQQRAATKDLARRCDALLADVLQFGLDPAGHDAAPGDTRRARRLHLPARASKD